MNSPQNLEEDLFNEAVRLASPAERATYLDRMCGGDVDLRQRVESLLQSHDQAGTFLENPPAEVQASTCPPTGQSPPATAHLAAITDTRAR